MQVKEEPYVLVPPEDQHTQYPDTNVRDYIDVLLRRRKTFLAAFLAVLLGAIAYTYTMKPVYEASATLHVRGEKPNSGRVNVFSFDAGNSVEAELEILKSRTNAEEVVRRLQLDWQVTKKSPGLEFKILEFTSTAEDPTYQVTLTGPESFEVADERGKVVARGKSGVPVRQDGLNLRLEILKWKVSDSFRLTLLPFNETVNGVRAGIKASETKKMTNVVLLSSRDTDPVKARDVVNTLVQVYLDRNIVTKSQEASKTLDFIGDQLKSVRTDLDASEKNLQSFKSASTTVVQLDAEAQSLIQKITQTEMAMSEATLRKKQVEFALASLKENLAKGNTYFPSVMRDDPLIQGMATKLADLEFQRKALLTDFTEEHPSVRAIRQQIDELHRRVQATYETSFNDLAKQEASLAQERGKYEERIRNLPEKERNLAGLMRYSRVNADIYTFLLQKHEETRIARASTISNIDIIDPAITPAGPVLPNKAKNLALGVIVGLLLGIGLAFSQDYLDDTIKDPDSAKRELGWPLLAAIPYIPRKGEGKGGIQDTLVSYHDPKAPVSEAFRSLRTGIHFSAITKKQQVLLVTSTFPGEGKTTVVSNLAITLSQTGARVLLLDCDLRKPALHDIFGRGKAPGLTELLAADTDIDAVIHNTDIPGFDMISAGTIPPNPAELLGSDRMRGLLKTLRTRYEHILIDAPPTLAVTDAPLLTSMSDIAIVVVEAGRVPAKAAQRMRETLETVGAPIGGFVMNDKDEASYRRYGSYGYSYYRSGYYQYGYGNKKEGRKKAKSKTRWRRWLKI